MVEAPAKSRSDVEILIEKFNDWADERIFDLGDTASIPFFSNDTRSEARGGLKWLGSAKRNLERLAKLETNNAPNR